MQAGRRGWRQGLEMSPSEGHLRVREAAVCRGGRADILTKDDEDGAASQEEKRKTSEDIYGCSEGGLEWQRRSIPHLMFGILGETNTEASTSNWSC